MKEWKQRISVEDELIVTAESDKILRLRKVVSEMLEDKAECLQ